MWNSLCFKYKTLFVLHSKVLVEISIGPSYLIPSSQPKGNTTDLFTGPVSLTLWIGQGWSLLWRSTPPALWNSLPEKIHHYSWLPHNFPFSHMLSLKAETHNQIGIKTAIPPEFACYIPNALMTKWEHNWEENCWNIAGLTLIVLILWKQNVPLSHCLRLGV